MHEFSTPMMRQYMEIRKDYPDCLLFFRMGDFYELFMEDAHTGARILNITLTGKAGGKDGKIPMAGVPYHAADAYITKLVKAGYKVAICEQLSPPNKKGLVKRGVVRIVTPGTIMNEAGLDKKAHNYILSLTLSDIGYSIAVSDVSTGYFAVKDSTITTDLGAIMDEISQLQPAECILPEELYQRTDLLQVLHSQKTMNIFPYTHFPKQISDAEKILKKHFGIATLKGFDIPETSASLIPAAALITYLTDTQNGNIPHIKKIVPYAASDGMILDRSTMINLELFATIRDHDTKGSLLSVLDDTITAMGGRLLKTWLTKPLREKSAIEERLDAVEECVEKSALRHELRQTLKYIPDIERLMSRLSVQLGNGRDILSLKHALISVLSIKQQIDELETKFYRQQYLEISDELRTLIRRIEEVMTEDPPVSVREGGMIKPGVDKELDDLRNSISDSKHWLSDLEKKEREATGIQTLKVKFNKVFGFYIEISKSNLHLVPAHYIRKQTLVNGERYITEALKKHEDIILTAEEKIHDIEYKIYLNFLAEIQTYTDRIQSAAQSIATIDVISTFAHISERYNYAKPKILYSGEIRIKEGRHPVVEQLLDEVPFVPNDTTLDNVSQSLILLTGPNMAGKSVYIRHVALIVLMAQIGCFVPAASAHISLVDRIFVRSGASDFITSGLSTFMVEMVETAHILNNATENSLIIMDEIGRGTSTYDGISIAWSVAEFLVTKHSPPPKVLFATHYHELQALEEEFPARIKNFHMAVTEQNGDPIFLHTLLPGGASHSFGVSVAKLAGVPEDVIHRAKIILNNLEGRNVVKEQERSELHKQDFSSGLLDHILMKELEQVDIATMTPLEALNRIATLKEKISFIKKQQHSREVD